MAWPSQQLPDGVSFSLAAEQFAVPLHCISDSAPSANQPVDAAEIDALFNDPHNGWNRIHSSGMPSTQAPQASTPLVAYSSSLGSSDQHSMHRDMMDIVGDLEPPQFPSTFPYFPSLAASWSPEVAMPSGDFDPRCVSASVLERPTFSFSERPEMKRQASDPSGLSPTSQTSPELPNRPRTRGPLAPRQKASKRGDAELFCQVPNCGSDLSDAKAYCKRYRICEDCISATSMMVEGLEHRYCQQCGYLHPLCEFDGAKRSCREKLLRHAENVRRKRANAAAAKKNGRRR